MNYSSKENQLARDYLDGQYNEIQFNYMIYQIGSTKEKMEDLVDNLAYKIPLLMALKFFSIAILFFICLSAIFCLIQLNLHNLEEIFFWLNL